MIYIIYNHERGWSSTTKIMTNLVVVVDLLSSLFSSNRPALLRNKTEDTGRSQRPSVNPEEKLTKYYNYDFDNNYKIITIFTKSGILYTK